MAAIDIEHMFGHWLYGWLVNQFPCLYQKLIKNPFELKIEKNYHLRVEKTMKRQESSSEGLDYLIMGHTHEPVGDGGKLFDCGT